MCTLLLAAAFALQDPAPVDLAAIEQTLRDDFAASGAPGAAVAIARDGEVVLELGLGVANVETGAPVEADMLFRIGSTTKIFTAAVVLGLVEDGELALDAPVGDAVEGLEASVARLTLDQLLSHTAGLVDRAPSYGPHDEDAMARVLRELGPDDSFVAPGRVFSYANPGFALAALAAREAGGRSFEEQVRRLARRVGARVTFEPARAMTWPFAHGHDDRVGDLRVVRPFADNAVYRGAGFLFASAPGLARLAIALMDDGRIDGRQALPEAVVRAMVTPRAEVASFEGGARYGYGMFVRRERGVEVWEHPGGTLGFTSTMILVPEHRVAVVALVNQSGGGLGEGVANVFEALVPLEPRADAPEPEACRLAPEELALLTGTYRQGHQRIELELDNAGELVVRRGFLAAPGMVLAGDRIRFALPVVGVDVLHLHRGEGGRVEFVEHAARALRRVDVE